MRLLSRASGVMLCLGLSSGLAHAAGPSGRLVFPSSGFSIAPLDSPDRSAPYQAVVMTLPASDGFAPNVNVQLQPFAGTLDEYIELSEKQMLGMGWKILVRRKDADSVTYEFSGTYQERPLHWYSKAVSTKGTVYLITSTAAESQWPTVQSALRTCVDSFRREGGK